MSALDIKYNKEMCDLFLIYFSLLCYNSFVVHELVEKEVKKGARGGLENANLSRQATDRDRSLEMVCCFALKFC